MSTLRLPGLKAGTCFRPEPLDLTQGLEPIEKALAEGLRVDPELRILTPPSKVGLDAADWVKVQK